MEELSIYLSGKCKDLPDDGKNWRDEIIRKIDVVAGCTNTRVTVVDPVKYFTYSEKKYKTQKQVKDYFIYRIRKSDLVVVNLNDSDSSIGTAQEIQFAVDHNIPIIGFGTRNIYPWIAEVDCQVVFDTMNEVVCYIADYYMNGDKSDE